MHNKRKCFTLTLKGQGHGVQYSQGPYLMADIRLYKSYTWAFSLAHTVIEIFTFQNSCPWKSRSRSWRITFTVAPLDIKFLTSILMAIVMLHFPAFDKITVEKFDLENLGQGHGVNHSQWSSSMENIDVYKSRTGALFASSYRFWDIHVSQFMTLKMYVKVIMYNTRRSASRW